MMAESELMAKPKRVSRLRALAFLVPVLEVALKARLRVSCRLPVQPDLPPSH